VIIIIIIIIKFFSRLYSRWKWVNKSAYRIVPPLTRKPTPVWWRRKVWLCD